MSAQLNRLHRGAGFTTVPNTLLRDSRLSFRARGLLAFVFSHSEDFVGDAAWIADQASEGREAVATALRELEAAGYRTIVKQQDAAGRWSTVVQWTDVPEAGQPAYGNPAPGMPGAKELENQGENQDHPLGPPEGGTGQAALLAVEEPVVQRVRKDRALPLPDTWQPPKESWPFAREQLPGMDLQLVLDAFVSHAQANDRRQVNWDAAWRQWIVTEARYQQRGRRA